MGLEDVASISVHQFFAGDQTTGTDFLSIWLQRADPTRILIADLTGGPDNPDIRSFIVPPRFQSDVTIMIRWLLFFPFPTNEDPARSLGFIDNVTFHPVPEPGAVALLVLGLVGVAIGRAVRG